MQMPAFKVPVTDRTELANVKSKHHARGFQYFPIVCWGAQGSARLSPLCSGWAPVHLCSDTFHWFGFSSGVQANGLQVLTHSASLL